MIRTASLIAAASFIVAACSGNVETTPKEDLALADIPAEALASAQAAIPGFTPESAESETRNGTPYIDIEGARPDGATVELDMRFIDGAWEVVEIQRDISADEVPQSVRAALPDSAKAKDAARIIESIQNDGRVVFEFYHRQSDGSNAKTEVLLDGETATLLDEEWEH